MNYDLLACDIDDTLVRFPDPASPRVTRAIQAAVGAGVHVVLVTGRAFRRALPIARSLGLSLPIICNHGGSIRDTNGGEILHRAVLPRPQAIEIITWLRTQDLCLMVFDGDLVYHDCTTAEVVPDFQVYTKGALSVFARDTETLVPEATEIVLCTSLDHDHLVRVYKRAMERFGTSARVLFSHPHGMDIMPKSSKSQSLAWLAHHLSVPQQKVMAIGDGENDLDMLAWAGLGVAMGDGSPQVKIVADVIAPSFAQDGAAWAIEKYLLHQ